LNGVVEKTEFGYIIRDHDRKKFEARKVFFQDLVNKFNKKYGEGTVEVEIKDQYFNMREKVEPVMHIVLKWPAVHGTQVYHSSNLHSTQ